jgi:hypothetical protein
MIYDTIIGSDRELARRVSFLGLYDNKTTCTLLRHITCASWCSVLCIVCAHPEPACSPTPDRVRIAPGPALQHLQPPMNVPTLQPTAMAMAITARSGRVRRATDPPMDSTRAPSDAAPPLPSCTPLLLLLSRRPSLVLPLQRGAGLTCRCRADASAGASA